MGFDVRRLLFAIPIIVWFLVYVITNNLLDVNMQIILSTIIAIVSFGLIYLLYYSYNKGQEKKMQYRICPKCLIKVDKKLGICPECGREL